MQIDLTVQGISVYKLRHRMQYEIMSAQNIKLF
jgi:hypothetical protein